MKPSKDVEDLTAEIIKLHDPAEDEEGMRMLFIEARLWINVDHMGTMVQVLKSGGTMIRDGADISAAVKNEIAYMNALLERFRVSWQIPTLLDVVEREYVYLENDCDCGRAQNDKTVGNWDQSRCEHGYYSTGAGGCPACA